MFLIFMHKHIIIELLMKRIEFCVADGDINFQH